MQKKPKVFKAIMTALLGLLIFGLVYLLSYLIAGGIIYILSKIPIINRLVGFLFHVRGDTPDMMLSLLAPILAYLGTMAVQESINKDKPTRGVSCVILGACITILHIVFIVINLICGDGILNNIGQALAGLAFFTSGRGSLQESSDDQS